MPSNANNKKKKAAKNKRQRERKKKNQKENNNLCSNSSSQGNGDLKLTHVENSTENDVLGSNNAIDNGSLVEEEKKDSCSIGFVEEGKSMEGSEKDGQKKPMREASMVAVEVVEAVKELESKLNRIANIEFLGNGKGSFNGDESKKEIIADSSVSQKESEDVEHDEIQVAKNLVELKEIMLETSQSNETGKKIVSGLGSGQKDTDSASETALPVEMSEVVDHGEVEQVGSAFEKLIKVEEDRPVGKPGDVEEVKLPSKARKDRVLTPSESPVIQSYDAGEQSQESEIIESSQNQPFHALPTVQRSSWSCCGLVELVMGSKR